MHKITLDCRAKECTDKIAKIFNSYETLDDGGEISLMTGSDPIKLYYEMLTKTNGNFHWIPIKEGPNDWQVLIEKTFTM
jgi:uncharacterized protein (DUF2249 family)